MRKTHTGSLGRVNGDSDKEMMLSWLFGDEPVTNRSPVAHMGWGDGLVAKYLLGKHGDLSLDSPGPV